MNDTDTMTVAELSAALCWVPIYVEGFSGKSKALFPAGLAADLMAVIRKNREPRYEAGQIYESEYGYRYMRVDDREFPWVELFRDGGRYKHEESYPTRPLRRLVPEEAE